MRRPFLRAERAAAASPRQCRGLPRKLTDSVTRVMSAAVVLELPLAPQPAKVIGRVTRDDHGVVDAHEPFIARRGLSLQLVGAR